MESYIIHVRRFIQSFSRVIGPVGVSRTISVNLVIRGIRFPSL